MKNEEISKKSAAEIRIYIPKGGSYEISCDTQTGSDEISFAPERHLSDGSDFIVADFLKKVVDNGKFSLPSISFINTITKHLDVSHRDWFCNYRDETIIIRADDYSAFEREINHYGMKSFFHFFNKYDKENRINNTYEALSKEEARALMFSLAVLKSIICDVCKYTEDFQPVCIKEYQGSKITIADLELIYDTLYTTYVKKRPYMFYSVFPNNLVDNEIKHLRFGHLHFQKQINSLSEIITVIHAAYNDLCDAYVRVCVPKNMP